MKRFTYTLASLLISSAFGAQQPAAPKAFQNFRVPPSATLRFLASEEGRAFLKATGNPLAGAAIRAFGEPLPTTLVPQAWLTDFTSKAASMQPFAQPATTPCGGPQGARFNLEPRANAVPQNQA